MTLTPANRDNTSENIPEAPRMKITGLKTFVVDSGNDENWVFVKIHTNAGLTGLGEGCIPAKARSVEAAILEHERYLVGKNPADIEHLWQGMFRGPRRRGGPILMSALAAVDIALWDILGQSLGVPIWHLLGGRARERVRVYAHAGWLAKHAQRSKHRIWQPREPDTSLPEPPQDWLERSVASWMAIKEAGFTAGKGNFLPKRGDVIEPTRNVRQGIELLAAVREALGPDFDIMCELHGQATPPMARAFCRQAEPFQPMWVEEPVQQELVSELEALRRQTSVPIAVGERLFDKFGFTELCSRQLADYLQPDVVQCGGITELRKIGAMSEAFRIQLAPHNPGCEVSTVASLHLCAALPSAVILEIGSGQTPFFEDLFNGGLFKVENGFAPLPDRPGLGLTLNEEVASRYPYQPKTWMLPLATDGSYLDR